MPALGLLFGRVRPGRDARAAVDAGTQIIVAHGLTQSMSDQDPLAALVDGIKKNLGRKPKEASADAGYCSEANLRGLTDPRSALTSQVVGPSTPPKPDESAAARSPELCATN